MNALTITTAGQTRIADALLRGVQIRAMRMGVGSSPASLLSAASTALGNELVRLSIETGTSSGSQIQFQSVVPGELGPFTLREVGIFDDTGTMIAFGGLPDIYKPAIVDGYSVAVRIVATLTFSATTPATVVVPATNTEDLQIYSTPNGTKVRLQVNDDLTVTPVVVRSAPTT